MQDWKSWLAQEKSEPYLSDVLQTVAHKRAQGLKIYPPAEQVFSAFEVAETQNIKVVILGQDPYHGAGQAHGFSFSVPEGIKIPPSLRNMYKELAQSVDGFEIPEHGNLQLWAEQGVFLLNTVLTVEEGKAHSHAKIGWETFTDKVMEQLNHNSQGLIFMLWGSHAQKKGRFIDGQRHFVLEAPHPSPLSAHRGFFGCDHFRKANELLKQQGKAMINWQV